MAAALHCIDLEVVRRLGWLRFARPPVNAFTWPMIEAVREGLARLTDDPAVRVVVLASAVPGYFSAEAHLAGFVGIGGQRMRRWPSLCHEIARALRTAPQPSLAAIHGTAVGCGLEMTLHCDLRFAAASARLGQPEIPIGFNPPVTTTQALARLLGRPQAIRYLYDGAMLNAAEAGRIGLVDKVVADDALADRVEAYAEALAGKLRGALAAIRRTVTIGGRILEPQGGGPQSSQSSKPDSRRRRATRAE